MQKKIFLPRPYSPDVSQFSEYTWSTIDAQLQETIDQLLIKHQYDDARDLVLPLVQEDPTDTDALVLLGVIQTESGQQEAAEKTLRWYFTCGGTSGEASEALGCCLMRQQRFYDAEPWLERARALLPQAASVHRNIAVLYHQTGRDQAAYHELQEAIIYNPDDIYALATMLPVLQRLDMPDEARNVARRLLSHELPESLRRYATRLLG